MNFNLVLVFYVFCPAQMAYEITPYRSRWIVIEESQTRVPYDSTDLAPTFHFKKHPLPDKRLFQSHVVKESDIEYIEV